MLFIKRLKKFIIDKAARCEAFQIKESNVLKFLKDFAQMLFKMFLNNLNTHD